jgi:hypothetical protein
MSDNQADLVPWADMNSFKQEGKSPSHTDSHTLKCNI